MNKILILSSFVALVFGLYWFQQRSVVIIDPSIQKLEKKDDPKPIPKVAINKVKPTAPYQQLLTAIQSGTYKPGKTEIIEMPKPGVFGAKDENGQLIDSSNGMVEAEQRVLVEDTEHLIRETVIWDLPTPIRLLETVEKEGTKTEKIIHSEMMSPDHVIVYFKPLQGLNVDEVVEGLGIKVNKRLLSNQLSYSLIIPKDVSVEEALSKLESNPDLVFYTEPDYIVSASIIPDDSNFSGLWALNNDGQTGGIPDADIDAVEAWEIEVGSAGVTVAVIDTGIDYTHPDLVDNMWVNQAELNGVVGVDDDNNGYVDDIYGYDFVNDSGDPMDDHFHGTHCAGTIGAKGNNATGVTGVNWNSSLMALKFLDSDGNGLTSDAVLAIDYARNNGALVLNNSWGGGSYSQALYDAIELTRQSGLVFVASAGNDGVDNDLGSHYPSGYLIDNVLSIAASDHNDELAWFSNYGVTSVDVAAPGVTIMSTFPTVMTQAMSNYGFSTFYESISGTSMAAPHVSGVMALMLSNDSQLSYQDLISKVTERIDVVPGFSQKLAFPGRINAWSLLDDQWQPEPADLKFKSMAIDDSLGNGNGFVEVGESILLSPTLFNQGQEDAENWHVVLNSDDPNVTISSNITLLGSIPNYSSYTATNAFQIEIDPNAPNGQLEFVVQIISDLGEVSSINWSLPVTNQVLSTYTEVDFAIGATLSDRDRNAIYMLDMTHHMLLALSTETGQLIKACGLNGSSGAGIDELKKGQLAMSVDKTKLFVSLPSSKKIQVISLPNLETLDEFKLNHEPLYLAHGPHEKLYYSTNDYWGSLHKIDALSGQYITSFIPNQGGSLYKGTMLKTSVSGDSLFASETGLRITGGPGHVHEFDISGGGAPINIDNHPFTTTFLHDFEVDEINRKIYTMCGGIYAVQVTDMDTGAYGELWDLGGPYGRAIAMGKNSPYVFAAHGSIYENHIVRKFDRQSGSPIYDYNIIDSITGSSIIERGLEVTSNDYIMIAQDRWTGNSSAYVNGYRYYLGLQGVGSLDLSTPVPVIQIDSNYGNAPLTVNFDATQSFVTGGVVQIQSYHWEFEDGIEATGPLASHIYTDIGLYKATLTITDDRGLQVSKSIEIDVHDYVDKINFQNDGVSPGNWNIDTGLAYSSTRGYGWTEDTHLNVFAGRRSHENLGLNEITYVMQGAGKTSYWEYDLPEGRYRVEVMCGRPVYSQAQHYIEIENEVLIDATATHGSHYFTEVAEVFVGDGKLSMQFGHSGTTKENYVNTITILNTDNEAPNFSVDPYAQENPVVFPSDSTLLIAAGNDPNGDVLTYTWTKLTGPADIIFSNNSNTSSANVVATFTKDGYYEIECEINDGWAKTSKTIILEVLNDPTQTPIVMDDAYQILEDETLIVDVNNGVLSNDSDPNGDVLSTQLVGDVQHGNLNLNADGSFTYQPDSNYYGTDSFIYRATDGSYESKVATVTINIDSENDAPIGQNDIYIGSIDQILSLEVLSNDIDVDGDQLQIISHSDTNHGLLELVNGTSFNYTPDSGYSGKDSFTYVMSDGHVTVGSMQVVVHILEHGERSWSTQGKDSNHTSHVPFETGIAESSPIWVAQENTNSLEQVAIEDGVVVVTERWFSNQPVKVWAFNSSLGELLWEQTFDPASDVSPPTIFDGSIYFMRGNHSSDSQLRKLNLMTGEVLWSSNYATQWADHFAPTVGNNSVFIEGGSYGGMYGYNIHTGSQIFFTGLSQTDSWSPTFYDNRLFSYAKGNFIEHNPTTGAQIWSHNVGGNWYTYTMNHSTVITEDKAILFGDPGLYVIDINTRQVLWSNTEKFYWTPAVANGIVYAIQSSKVKAYDFETGALVREYQASGTLEWQPIVSNDKLFIASDQTTFIFDFSDSTPEQTLARGGRLSLADRQLFIAGDSGEVAAYKLLGPPNREPVIESLSATSQNILISESTSLNVVVSDEDGDALSINWLKLSGPGEVQFSEISDVINTTATFSEVGEYVLQVEVSDGQISVSSSLIINVAYPIVGEVGEIEIEQLSSGNWQEIQFANVYQVPVVVATILTNHDSEPLTVRLKNIQSESFEMQLDEYDYQDGIHGIEKVAYCVLEAGHHILSDGTVVMAGKVNVNSSSKQVHYPNSFISKPVVFSQVVSTTDSKAVITRQKNINISNFTLSLQGQESNKSHGDEWVDWIAFESTLEGSIPVIEVQATARDVNHQWHPIIFGNSAVEVPVSLVAQQSLYGGDTASTRIQFLDHFGLEVKIEEEQSKDAEVNHTKEEVGYAVLEKGDLRAQYSDRPELILEHGVLDTVDDNWQVVQMTNQYTSPVIVCTLNYDNTFMPLVVRLKDVTSTQFEIKVQRVDGLIDSIQSVSVHYLVVEEGIYTEAIHGINLEATKFNTTKTSYKSGWSGEVTTYSQPYAQPIVLGQVMSNNNTDFSTFFCHGSSLQQPPSTNNLAIGKHIGEDSNKDRVSEELGYIVVESGQYQLNGFELSTGITNDFVRGINDSPAYTYPVNVQGENHTIILTQAGMDGGDGSWVILYGDNPLDGGSLHLSVDEDIIGDTDRKHTTEQVGYLIFSQD